MPKQINGFVVTVKDLNGRERWAVVEADSADIAAETYCDAIADGMGDLLPAEVDPDSVVTTHQIPYFYKGSTSAYAADQLTRAEHPINEALIVAIARASGPHA